MTHPVLPKLKANHNVRVFLESGKWDVRTRDALETLSGGLKVDKVETEISSIPDMWARPMLFEMALFNDQHVLHERTLGEWRGLLAMMALKEVASLDRLTVKRVKVSLLPQAGDGEEETRVPERDFLHTLSKLLPKASLAKDTSWQTLFIFLFDGKAVGMTSPTTLVATAADCLNRISSQEVSWYNGTHLKDPVPKLSPRQKQILSGWLNQLIARMNAHAGRDADRWNLLSGLLGNFRDELGPGNCSLSQSGFEIQGPEAGIFKYLDKPADGNIKDASHVWLIPSEGRSPAKPLLVVDRGIAEQWNMALQDVTVQGAHTLASARVELANAEVWKAADFFTRKLFVIFQESAFPGTLGAGNQSLTLPGGTTSVTPILPLRWELMHHLTADDLANRVRWDQTPEGLKIRLFLRLSGPDPDNQAGRTIELTKLYRREDIQTMDNVPILEIWPNFKAAGWKAYYTCYSTDDATSTFDAKPYAIGKAIDSEVPLKGREKRRYWRTENYPEAMICRASVPNTQTNQMEVQDAGLLLLDQPELVLPRGRSYRVGVDFGAANTTVCARLGDVRFPVKFIDRKVSVTASGDIAQAKLFNFFLPPGPPDSEMPLLSFFQSFDNSGTGREVQPFLNGHIYLLFGAGTFDPNQPGMAFDLKWSSEDRDRRMVKAFLGQLCLQTSAELVADGATSAGWAFSYPTAFSDEQMEGFPEIWNQVTTDVVSFSGLNRTSLNAKQTESVATALYFVDHLKAATSMGTIFVDIGGSTSDIAVWQGEEDKGPVWQTSLLLAGRDLFSNYLWHDPGFLGLFGDAYSQLPEEKLRGKGNKKPYNALTDALLRYNSKQIFAELPVHAGTRQVKALRQHLALGVSGLFYYVGSLLRYLMQIGIYRNNVPNVYVGGNGSQIFRWLDIDGEGHINALYKAVFSQGAGWTDDQAFKVILSPEPKMEAAYGLVSDSNLQGGNLEHRVLAGESFMAEGSIEEWPGATGKNGKTLGLHSLQWNAILTPEAFTKKLAPPEKLERFNDFITAFNQFARSKGLVSTVDLNNEEAQEVRRRLGQSMSQYRNSKTTANIIVEPVFIIALRHWLEIRLGG
jgi:hypothetical protein